MLIFRFEQRITSYDTQLGKKIREELPTFIVKSNKAYQEMSALHGTKNVWSVLPAEFKEASESSLAVLSVTDLFLRSYHVTFDENAVYTVRAFLDSLQFWLDENHMEKTHSRNPDAMKFSLDKFGCKMGVANVTHVDGTTERMEIVVGVRLKMEEPLVISSFEM